MSAFSAKLYKKKFLNLKIQLALSIRKSHPTTMRPCIVSLLLLAAYVASAPVPVPEEATEGKF